MRRIRAVLCVALGVSAVGCDKQHTEEEKVTFLHAGDNSGAVPTERRVEVVAVPEIVHQKYGHSLALPDNIGGIKELYCGSVAPVWFEQLVPGGEARLIVWERTEVTHDGYDGYYRVWDLGEVWVGDTCLFDAAICPLHRAQMKRGLIPIHYGKPAGEFLKAHQAFSGGPGFAFGGCCVDSASPKETFGYRCPDCVAGYQEWCNKQQVDRTEDGQQAVPSDGHKPSSHATSTDPTAPADAH